MGHGVTLVSRECARFHGDPDDRGSVRAVILVGNASDVDSMPLNLELVEDVEDLGTHSAAPETGDGDGVLADYLELPLVLIGLSAPGRLPRCSTSSDERWTGRQTRVEEECFFFVERGRDDPGHNTSNPLLQTGHADVNGEIGVCAWVCEGDLLDTRSDEV